MAPPGAGGRTDSLSRLPRATCKGLGGSRDGKEQLPSYQKLLRELT